MRSLAALLAVLSLSFFAGCGLLPEERDETVAWSANKLYAEAKTAMADGAFDKAIKYFEKLEARYPYGRFAQQAQLEVAYAHYKQQEKAQAIAECDRFIRLHPNHANVDYAYYLKGLVNFNEDLGLLGYVAMQDLTERDPKAAQESFEAFKALVNRFPESKYAQDATLRMAYLVNALASHEVHVAEYYMKRGAYVAAVNRAQYAMLNYPQTPAVEQALFVMVKAYDALGMTDLRDDADRVIRKNFPNSAYFKGTAGKKDPWWMLWGNAW
ncbi:MAG: outer membrane protein assembly factor BamD [Rhodocyclaceae bacterium]|nr:outer membrane protein assembly factor BamD [Rhodocyclaceae bacterium]